MRHARHPKNEKLLLRRHHEFDELERVPVLRIDSLKSEVRFKLARKDIIENAMNSILVEFRDITGQCKGFTKAHRPGRHGDAAQSYLPSNRDPRR